MKTSTKYSARSLEEVAKHFRDLAETKDGVAGAPARKVNKEVRDFARGQSNAYHEVADLLENLDIVPEGY